MIFLNSLPVLVAIMTIATIASAMPDCPYGENPCTIAGKSTCCSGDVFVISNCVSVFAHRAGETEKCSRIQHRLSACGYMINKSSESQTSSTIDGLFPV
ncbi:hypothetical protein KEM48_007395 [Puccinia striiformis f. sp. tritici PST-130]|nr:hypothetical protein KEM48_007395 [Puccinia striiformis f. sp. tritici PST-130]